MPCAFTRPRLMMLHSALALQIAQNFAKDSPLIWAGDYNFKPDSPNYKHILTGKIDKDEPNHPEKILPKDDDWKPEIRYPMRSVYGLLGGEPEFTNFAQTAKDEEPFCDVLDYIFISNHWKPRSVRPLPKRYIFATPLPTEEEPSDHLLISVELEL